MTTIQIGWVSDSLPYHIEELQFFGYFLLPRDGGFEIHPPAPSAIATEYFLPSLPLL